MLRYIPGTNEYDFYHGAKIVIFGEKDKRGVLSGEMGVWELGVGSLELGVGSREFGVVSVQCGVFRDRNLEFRKVFSELCAFFVFFVVKMLNSMTNETLIPL